MIRRCPSCGRQNRIPARHLADTGKCGKCKAALPPTNTPLDVDPEAFDEIIAAAKVPVLVDFWAPWCGPCRMAAPYVEEVANREAGRAIVLKLNTEDHPAVAQRFGVRGIPMFLVFDGGRPVREHVGLATASQLGALVRGA